MTQIGKGSAKRSTPSYFMSILGVSLVLFILGLLGWIVINANKLGQYFKENVEVRVYLRENISPADSTRLVDYIATKPYVKEYQYVTKDLARQKFVADGNEDWKNILDANPLPASIDFKLKNQYVHSDTLKAIKTDLEQNIAVSDVQYPQSLVDNLNKNVQKVSMILLIIAVVLCLVVIVLIDNTIRLAMFSNRFLIKTMQMVGATRWFIAKPMDIRAIINGAISGLIALAGIFALVFFAEKQLPELRAMRDTQWLVILSLVIILLGIMISLLSTHRSVVKYLKMKLDDLY
ncbi:permease-like cell division protein FtsX [Flavihumibacter rivuli]|uniref:cell division protein FtsX n=1 Tax=Flavihumibacter rivuli TaxID=2838156 RepID=UPI001BDEA260|nr:permease-like cell division protein FtsX [Flavihumibacter rivuli]ULQ56389.1 permease-like cell division protein FtsX [Flavihumibacter rivuli]